MVSNRQAGRGFTLVELVITMAIAAILLSLAVPSFKGMVARSNVRTASTSIYLSLLKARSSAARLNAKVTVRPCSNVPTGPTDVSCTATTDWALGLQVVCLADPTNSCQNGASDTSLGRENAMSGVSITGAPASVVYLTSGRTQGAASIAIRVSPTTSLTDSSHPVWTYVCVDTSGHPYLKSQPNPGVTPVPATATAACT